MSQKCHDLLRVSPHQKADDEGQVVAKAALVAVAIISAEGLEATVLFVFFKEEGGIVDIGAINGRAKRTTDQYVVDALPTAFVAIGALGAMLSPRLLRDIMEAVRFQKL